MPSSTPSRRRVERPCLSSPSPERLAAFWTQATALPGEPSISLSSPESGLFGDPGLVVELPAVVVHGDVAHLAWRRPLALGRAEAEVVEDLVDGRLVVKVGDDRERTSAIAAGERIGVVDLRDQPGPAR